MMVGMDAQAIWYYGSGFGESHCYILVMSAIKIVTANPQLHARDLGGSAMMSDVTNAVSQ